eukprot:TRINITY_DN36956_c0_g1_i1.p1 TRINITY_DN36956_c0_g1~~TRINITY_DN36956_c0_g1_i1.p1  ORF type:complete len:112 (+),score=18.65 TRINITY_DN36956_c0_g1_i1:124-459(+)
MHVVLKPDLRMRMVSNDGSRSRFGTRAEDTASEEKNDRTQHVIQALLHSNGALQSDAVFSTLRQTFPKGPDPRASTRILSGLAKHDVLDIAIDVFSFLEIAAISACKKGTQ